MHEGKNIHYSVVDQKPLCSFSGKVCNQRRLNKYGFCVRHILEDPEAPFKRCAYVAKSSKQTCTQPIPRNEERLYCNNHMQVMGMLPKKERKPKKEKEKLVQAPLFASQLEHQELFQNPLHARLAVDSQITAARLAADSQITAVGRDDVEDVYAFPTDPGEGSQRLNHVSTIIASVGAPDLSQGIAKSVNYIPQKPPGESGSLAKIYPELAEKLEKIKPKVETKVKGKAKSSRTMNSLQTKIAQNKIKDKLKRNHESSASSQSQSPSSSFNSANSPGFHLNTSSPSVQVESPGNISVSDTKLVTLSEDISAKEKLTASSISLTTDSEQLRTPSITSLPGLPQLTQLNTLGFPGLNLSLGPFGLPLPTASDVEETLKQLAKVTPVPIEGALFTPEGAAGLIPRLPLAGLPAGAFIPTDLLTLHHLLRPQLGPQSGPPPPYPGTQNRTSATVSQVTSLPTVSVPAQVAVTEGRVVNQTKPVTAEQSTQCKQTVTSKYLPVSVPNIASNVSTRTTTTASIPVKSTESLKPSAVLPSALPPNSVKTSKSRTPRSKVSPVSKTRTPMALLSLPVSLAKPRKLRNVLSETAVKKIKTDSAIKYYRMHKRRKLDNHNLLVAELLDSDSDSSDCDMLPWQPDWFSASSDEDLGDDEEDDQCFDLRTTKLALSRARLRRQCFQSKKSYCASSTVRDQDSKSVSALIAAARENPRVAVQSVYDVTGSRPKPVNKYKRRGLEKRKCCYKNDDDVQCKNFVVPYTNHCSRHVMYNVDQQLFEYCTAKFADNTQCCVPVIDLKHELPLCVEHGIKADNYQKLQDSEPKPKRPRKKTKPSALTRPSRKGKKKKIKKKTTRPQKTAPPVLPTIDTDIVDTEEDVASPSHDDDDDKTEDEDDTPQKAVPSKIACLKSTTPSVPPRAQLAEPHVRRVSPPQAQEKFQKVSSLEELDNLGGLQELENEKMFGELPLETASRFLEENDFQEVLNRLPEETFDLFTYKNGMFEPTNEEVEELEKSIAMANKDFKSAKDSFEQISTSQSTQAPFLNTSQSSLPPILDSTSQSSLPPILDEADELTKQIAEEILSQNLGSAISSQSINTADAQESIKAIARSLSTSGQFLAPQTSDPIDFDNPALINNFQKPTSSIASAPSFSQQTFLRKDSIPSLAVQTQSSRSYSSPQFSNSLDLNSIPLSLSSSVLMANTAPVRPSVVPTHPVTSNATVKQFSGGSVPPTSDSRLLPQAQSVDSASLPSNIPLAQQQLLQLMSVRQQTPLQFQTVPTPSQRPPDQQAQVRSLTIAPQLTAEQILEKQRLIQQQKQQLEAQQQQLMRQQQQLAALTQHKQQLDSLAQQQQQQQIDPQLLQQNILQHLGTSHLPPAPSLPMPNRSSEQQTVVVHTQPQVVSKLLTTQSQVVTQSLPTQSQVVSQPISTKPLPIQPLPAQAQIVSQPLPTQPLPSQSQIVSQPLSAQALPAQAQILSQPLPTQPLLAQALPAQAQIVSQPLPTQPLSAQALPAQAQIVSQPLPIQPEIVSQSGAVSNTVSANNAVQPTFLSTLPHYVGPIHQVPLPMLPQEPKSNQVLQTAQLLELQQQLTLFAQHQQLLLQQQLANMSQQNISQQNISRQSVANINQQNVVNINQQNVTSRSQQSVAMNQQTITSLNQPNVSRVNQQNVLNSNWRSVSNLTQQNFSNLNQQNISNLNQQSVSNLTSVNDRNQGVFNQGQSLTMSKNLSATQTPLIPMSSSSQTRTIPDVASSKVVTSHAPTSQETKHKNVISSNPQAIQVQYPTPKQETMSGKLSTTNLEKPVSKKQTHKQSNSAKAAGSQSSSPSTVSQSKSVTSESSLLANIDTKTMTTKALEQHIVQMAYQQALAKQNEEDLERSKSAKKSGSKKHSQKGTKRNTAGSKKSKEVVKTPEMLRRQSELEEQLAQLAKQNMAQKQKSLMKPVSQPPVGTDMFKHVTVPTTTISWKPFPHVGQKYPNGIPEDPISKTTVVPHSGGSKTVNLSSTVNLSLTSTSQLTSRPMTKHLGPPPSYHHTMTANLTKSSSAPS